MSRVGKKPIEIPSGVTVEVSGSQVAVKGPKGNLDLEIKHPIEVQVADNQVIVVPKADDKISEITQFWGLYRALIQNLIVGVSQGYEKKLQVEGVGYRVNLQGTKLVLALGYSHPVEVEAPAGITFAVEKNVITVSGIDKQLVGQVAANIRSKREPEPYKGKGVRYVGEYVRMKEGKKAAK